MLKFPIVLRESGNGLSARARMNLYRVCEGWHSGQRCPLYSVLSTGTIHSAEHLDDVINELSRIEDTNAIAIQYRLEYWRRDYMSMIHIYN